MKVHQLLSGAGPHDAITTEAMVFRRYFRDWGWGGGDHAFRIHPSLGAPIAAAATLAPDADDVVLLHHSAGWPQLDTVLGLPGHTLLLYHNVTPPGWFWADAPGVAAHCQLGREQLAPLVAAVSRCAADSAFNAAELTQFGARAVDVIPLLLDPARLGGAVGYWHDSPEVRSDAPNLLFVGRLSPHKRQDEIIRTFGLFRRVHAPAATLTLVGDPISPGYVDQLHGLADRWAPGAVRIASGLDDVELSAVYRRADLFLCLSEHEGFCIPLLEAFAAGVPVIARPFGAIPEVAGDAALLVPDHDPAVIAELIALVLGDPELPGELVRRGRERLGVFRPEQIAPRLRRAVEHAAAGPVAARS